MSKILNSGSSGKGKNVHATVASNLTCLLQESLRRCPLASHRGRFGFGMGMLKVGPLTLSEFGIVVWKCSSAFFSPCNTPFLQQVELGDKNYEPVPGTFEWELSMLRS